MTTQQSLVRRGMLMVLVVVLAYMDNLDLAVRVDR
jgi:hypothetical protein